MSWGQQLWKNTWQIHYSPTTSKENQQLNQPLFQKYNTISCSHNKIPTHDWQNLNQILVCFFLVSYYYIPFFAIVVQGWFDSSDWENAGISQVHSNTTLLLLLCDFVVSQWRSFVKWQRIFRFLAELFKGEFYNLPPLYNYWQTCLVDILQWLKIRQSTI